MRQWNLIFLILAIVSAILWLTGAAGPANDIALILFLAFLVLLGISVVSHVLRGNSL